MSKILIAFLAGLALALPAPAAPKKPHPHAAAAAAGEQLAIESQTSSSVTFAVSMPGALLPYSLWVANVCSDAAGVTVTAEYQPVVWSDAPNAGSAGPFSTDGSNPAAGQPVACRAFVWLFPDAWTPVSNVVDYPV